MICLAISLSDILPGYSLQSDHLKLLYVSDANFVLQLEKFLVLSSVAIHNPSPFFTIISYFSLHLCPYFVFFLPIFIPIPFFMAYQMFFLLARPRLSDRSNAEHG